LSSGPVWPGGAPGALSLSFDNLGEAAELELGALAPDAPLGRHFTATRVLPSLLPELKAHGLAATFFVEGLNTELYPEQLVEIAAAGHELGYHAWRHEQWATLTALEQAENLARGLAGFKRLDLAVKGLRPPGGGLGPGGLGVLREAGLRYCSPSGAGVGEDGGIALLPFQWRHVDATCVLPPLSPVREQMSGSADQLGPAAFVAHLEAELDRIADGGGFLTIVLHLLMLDWLGHDRLATLLDKVGKAAAQNELWVAPCAAVAEYVLARPEPFQGGAVLDPTSWIDTG
jgi:peptidoglycan/xylan/chitin deacetylase (PgdA/CDA1 family)